MTEFDPYHLDGPGDDMLATQQEISALENLITEVLKDETEIYIRVHDKQVGNCVIRFQHTHSTDPGSALRDSTKISFQFRDQSKNDGDYLIDDTDEDDYLCSICFEFSPGGLLSDLSIAMDPDTTFDILATFSELTENDQFSTSERKILDICREYLEYGIEEGTNALIEYLEGVDPLTHQSIEHMIIELVAAKSIGYLITKEMLYDLGDDRVHCTTTRYVGIKDPDAWDEPLYMANVENFDTREVRTYERYNDKLATMIHEVHDCTGIELVPGLDDQTVDNAWSAGATYTSYATETTWFHGNDATETDENLPLKMDVQCIMDALIDIVAMDSPAPESEDFIE